MNIEFELQIQRRRSDRAREFVRSVKSRIGKQVKQSNGKAGVMLSLPYRTGREA